MITDDPLAAIERQLVAAASRSSSPRSTIAPHFRTPRGVALAFAAILVLALPAGAATGLWTGLFATSSRAPSPRVVNRAPSGELRDVLGVLRRPQQPGDRDVQVVRWADWGGTRPGASQRPVVELPGVRMANRI